MRAGVRLLLVGRGHLGTYLAGRWDLAEDAWWRGEFADLTETHLATLSPEVVVNCAAKTDLDWCEAQPRAAFAANVAAPLALHAALGRARGAAARLVHIGSGCLWAGPYTAAGRPFTPADPPAPACFYAYTKALCDLALLAAARAPGAPPVAVLRPRLLYSHLPSPRNALTRFLAYPRLVDTENSMTSARTVARTIERLLEAPTSEAWGRALHVYDRGVISPLEVGRRLAAAGLRAPPERLERAALVQRPPRVDVVLADALFEALVGPPGVGDEVGAMIGGGGGGGVGGRTDTTYGDVHGVS